MGVNDTKQGIKHKKMQISKFIELLNEKIAEANDNINEIAQFHLINTRSFGYTAYYYDDGQVENALNKLNKWQQVVQDILKMKYQSDKHENYIRFCKTIESVKRGLDFKKELPKEYNNGITVLEGIIESVGLLDNNDVNIEDTIAEFKRTKKVFISHSSKDADFAKALVNLLFLMGFQCNEIFCSSVPGCWVDNGEDFFKVIKKHFQEYDLFVIFIHSPRFYESHVSMNEMGAAWVLQSEYSSFLTADMSFNQMDAVVSNTEVAVKMNGDETKSRMNDWKNRMIAWFDKQPIQESFWEMQRDEFIEKTCQINYPLDATQSLSIQLVEKNEVPLSVEDKNLLKEWVDSNDNKLYQAWYSNGSAVFGLGAKNQHEVNAGREIAEWLGFFKRLLKNELIEIIGYTQKEDHPKYQLTEKAYMYFDK